MNIFLLILGIVLTIIGLIEALWTTIWIDGNSAPITSRLTTVIWKFFRVVVNRKNDRVLSLAGPVILISTVFFWILLLWFGWSFILYADSGALTVKSTNSSPDFTDVIWYVAYTMFTVGNGDFIPKDDIWQVVSSLVAFSGMTMVTLSITYLLQVVSAVANKRAFSNQIFSIGKTAEEFVIKQWTGDNFGAIELQLNTLSSQLSTLSEQHLAFPILHYYHAARVEKSQDVAIAIFSDALALIELGIEKNHHPAKTILSSSRQSIDSFLTTVKSAFIKPAKETPEQPKLSRLKEHNLPVVSEEEFFQKLKKETDRRKLILGLINKGAWYWPAAN